MSFSSHDPRMLAPGRFFLLVDVAAGLFGVWMVLLAFGGSDGSRPLVQFAWALLLFVLFFRRGQDEFWDACWRRGTAAAFLALVVMAVGWAFADGLITRFGDGRPALARATNYEPSFDAVVALLFLTFFAAFQSMRFRGPR